MASGTNNKIIPLAPKSDLDEKNRQYLVYKTYLDEVFENDKLGNIALSGILGSGKSSIIRSYDRQRNHGGKRRFLYVSLIDFEKEDAAPPKDTDKGQRRLEYNLLCQIFSCCRPADLKDSSIGMIPQKTRFPVFAAALFSAACLAAFVLAFHDQFGNLAKLWGVSEEIRASVHLHLYGFLGIVVAVSLFLLFLKYLPIAAFRKVTLKSGLADAEVVLGKDSTSLDKYKFELIYALCQIGKQIDYTVVFEDLDRVEEATAIDIMEKLREVNQLVNNQLAASRPWYAKRFPGLFSKNRHFRFLYAISDGILGREQRVKFFDCIIPIVPALNRFNSWEVLNGHLRRCGVKSYDQPTRQAVDIISQVLVDYRKLIDVRNEYCVLRDIYLSNHRNKFDSMTHREEAELLAVAAYKTLLPRAYDQAFSENGQARLEKVTDVDFPDYKENQSFCDQVIKSVNALFDSGILTQTALRMVGYTNAQITDRWIRILVDGADKEKLDLLASFTDTAYFTNPAFSAEAQRFVNKLIRERVLARNTKFTISNQIADILCKTSNERHNWFYDGFQWGATERPLPQQMQHFTNCFAYLASAGMDTLLLISKKKGLRFLFCCCIWNLSAFSDSDFVEYRWTKKMTKMLQECLNYAPDEIPAAIADLQILQKKGVYQLLPS